MTENSASSMQGWDAKLYDQSFGFISDFGAGLVELLAPTVGERIVDLGCGIGQLTADIAARGAEVIGVDADPEMIALARHKHPDLNFICASGEDFSLPEQADGVFSNAALHWMKQPETVIANVKRALRPGGRFVAEMGAFRNVVTITEALYRALEEQSVPREAVEFPWYFPRTSAYVGLLEAGGFDVTSFIYFARPTPLDNCPNGLSDWIRMFGGGFLAAVPEGGEAKLVARTEELCRDRLCQDGCWVTDYTRLRFRAELWVDY